MDIKRIWARAENHGGERGVPVCYLVLHGEDGMCAQARAEQLSQTVTGVSTHFYVDESGVWQAVPTHYAALHCGTRGAFYHAFCRNRNSIGVTLCRAAPADVRDPYDDRTLAHAASLIIALELRYALEPACVLRHYDVTHTVCPAPLVRDREQWQRLRAYF